MRFDMISETRALAMLESAAGLLRNMSYGELSELEQKCKQDPQICTQEIEIEQEPAWLSTVERYGLFRRRISVEMTISADSDDQWSNVPCVYFERFKSGRLYEARVLSKFGATSDVLLLFCIPVSVCLLIALIVWCVARFV